ncbi:MAG: hypothetical protein IIC50_14120 [Planctomycetes bacterium]|nr:hypothetical protein [Planctomycetota bacterium]
MKEDQETALALRAMERAARIARRQAAEKNLKMPVWKNGAIVFIDPKEEPTSGATEASP